MEKGWRVVVFFLFVGALPLRFWQSRSAKVKSAPEAPTGMDTLTNGLVDQATHDGDRETFQEVDTPTDGLGPVYNATACVDCHQNPVTGGISQVTELRAGHSDANGNFVPATVTINDGGGLTGVTIANRSRINQRATCPGVITAFVTHAIVYNHP